MLLVVVAACSSPSARAIDAAQARDAAPGDGNVLFDAPELDAAPSDAVATDGAVIDGAAIDGAVSPDAHLVDAAMPDAHVVDAAMTDAAVGATVHVTGVVDGIAGAHVTNVGTGATVTTDANGNFAFDVASGSTLIMRATANDSTHLPMVRGVVAQAGMRTRHFLLETTSQLSAMMSLGVTFDPAKAIVMIDFRHAQGGGYGAKFTQGASVVQPGFGVADSGGDYVLATTTQTSFVTTLLLANLATVDTKIEPIVPSFATLPCQVRDAVVLPLEANTVTWVDFECGTDPTP